MQIARDVANADKKRYKGPCTGKVNIINKQTGIRCQINKHEYDDTIHLALGRRSYLFKCKAIATNKEKLINIYEWDLVKDDYIVIDAKEFSKCKELL